MASRRKARSIALQILYQADWSGNKKSKDAANFARESIEEYEKELATEYPETDPELSAFVEMLVTGVLERRQEIDSLISRFSKKWKLNRMAAVDRNILRMGIFELCYLEEIPPRVAMNEAVELAKRFGDASSPGFVNGILDAVFRQVCNSKITN